MVSTGAKAQWRAKKKMQVRALDFGRTDQAEYEARRREAVK